MLNKLLRIDLHCNPTKIGYYAYLKEMDRCRIAIQFVSLLANFNI